MLAILFPPTFEWSGNNKGLSAIKGKARVWRMDDEVMCPDPSSRKWTTSQKLRAQENSPLPLLFTPSHPTPISLPGEKEETVSIYELIHYILSSDTHKKRILPFSPSLRFWTFWESGEMQMRWNILHERLHALHSSANSLDFMSFDKAEEKKQGSYVKEGKTEKENEKG